jgi:acetyl-CoA decarbonylase/synthase complex subunit delta
MAFTKNPQVFPSAIAETTIGTGDKTLTLGGERVMMFYSFDEEIKNPPAVGIEISDLGPDMSIPGIAALYEGASTLAEQAKRAEAVPGAQFLCLKLDGADPNGENESIEASVAKVKEVADAISLPIVVQGCDNIDKDAELLPKVAEALQGKNALLLSAKEENYKGIAVAAVTAYGQKLAAESAVDINLAKQVNVMIGKMGVGNENLVAHLGNAAAGDGFEYLSSTFERVKLAAMGQKDVALQVPTITPIGADAWGVKETMASEEDYPEWGPREDRGIDMEVCTATAILASGGNAVFVRHPASVAALAKLVAELS